MLCSWGQFGGFFGDLPSRTGGPGSRDFYSTCLGRSPVRTVNHPNRSSRYRRILGAFQPALRLFPLHDLRGIRLGFTI